MEDMDMASPEATLMYLASTPTTTPTLTGAKLQPAINCSFHLSCDSWNIVEINWNQTVQKVWIYELQFDMELFIF